MRVEVENSQHDEHGHQANDDPEHRQINRVFDPAIAQSMNGMGHLMEQSHADNETTDSTDDALQALVGDSHQRWKPATQK